MYFNCTAELLGFYLHNIEFSNVSLGTHLPEALEVQFLQVHLASQHFPAGNQMALSIVAVITVAYDFITSVLPLLLATLECLRVRQHLVGPGHREERDQSVVE